MFTWEKKNPSFLLSKLKKEEQKKTKATREKEIKKMKPKSIKIKTEKL